MNIVHVSDRTEAFHSLLDMDVNGLYFVSDVHLTELTMDVERMRMVLPQNLLKQDNVMQGCLYFRGDIPEIQPDDFKEVSQKIGIPLFVEPPEKVPTVCAHIIQNICQSTSS